MKFVVDNKEYTSADSALQLVLSKQDRIILKQLIDSYGDQEGEAKYCEYDDTLYDKDDIQKWLDNASVQIKRKADDVSKNN